MMRYTTMVLCAASPLLAVQEISTKHVSKKFDIAAEHRSDFCNADSELLWLSRANAYLLSQNYAAAIASYEQAEKTERRTEDSGLAFLIAFGKVIAYDHLQQKAKQDEAFSILYALAEVPNLEEDGISENTLTKNETTEYLFNLANSSFSSETSSKLSLLLRHVFSSSEMERVHGCAKPPLYEEEMYCSRKSLWKQVEKLAHNIRRVCIKICELAERFLDIADRIDGYHAHSNHLSITEDN